MSTMVFLPKKYDQESTDLNPEKILRNQVRNGPNNVIATQSNGPD